MPNGSPANLDAYWEIIGAKGTIQMRDPADSFSIWTPEGVRWPDPHLGPEVAGKSSYQCGGCGAYENYLA